MGRAQGWGLGNKEEEGRGVDGHDQCIIWVYGNEPN
jgi:hypothetical protein